MQPEGLNLAGGYLQRLSGGATLEQIANSLNDVIDTLNQQLQSQIFSDGTTKRMILGYQQDGWGAGKNFGIKISQAGVDVTTAADSKLLFKMDLQTWSYYDPATGKNFMQIGILPDGSGGWTIADKGFDVSEVYNA